MDRADGWRGTADASTAQANETFAAGIHSGRDDLVGAVALAVWVANKCLDRESLQLDLHQ